MNKKELDMNFVDATKAYFLNGRTLTHEFLDQNFGMEI